MFTKGQIIRTIVTGSSHLGDGVTKPEGFTVFVAGALPGEEVELEITEVKKNFARGRLVQILAPAAARVAPVCSQAADCGGCQLLHLAYHSQLELKQTTVANALQRIAGLSDVVVNPVLGMTNPGHYRNKVFFQVLSKAGKQQVGYYERGTHRFVPAAECRLVAHPLLAAAQAFEEEINRWDISPNFLTRVMLRWGAASGEIMVVPVVTGRDWPAGEEIAAALVAKVPAVVSVIQNVATPQEVNLGNWSRVLYGREYITDYMEELVFHISPDSFYQVNPEQMGVLYRQVLAAASLSGQERVLDLYCGIGTITLLLARSAQSVVGVEEVPVAVADAEANAAHNGIKNVIFHSGTVEKILPQLVADEAKFDLAVLDPPRQGCHPRVLEVLVKVQPPKIIYVSCDPATLARDVKFLVDQGYRVEHVQPVDMFPQTGHVECVIGMQRKDT